MCVELNAQTSYSFSSLFLRLNIVISSSLQSSAKWVGCFGIVNIWRENLENQGKLSFPLLYWFVLPIFFSLYLHFLNWCVHFLYNEATKKNLERPILRVHFTLFLSTLQLGYQHCIFQWLLHFTLFPSTLQLGCPLSRVITVSTNVPISLLFFHQRPIYQYSIYHHQL